MRTTPLLELLAPAKTADIGIAAVNHGADAIYIGGPSFGARHNASNSVQDLERLVQHAHRYHSRVFVTLNTILRDDELEAARRLCYQLFEAGVDALILQDMGLLMLDLPPIQLHASTQCDVRTPEKARFLEEVGFSQIVVARELDLGQIRSIHDALDQAVVEYFVHGALCVAYSGQCYISHAQTGRSANRGDCSQACRLPYDVQDAKGRYVAHQKHVLSIKDNDQSKNLAELIDAGVRSFKIEGRYKDLAYVKNLTGHYRQLLDQLLEDNPSLMRSSSGTTRLAFKPEPERSFNRGSTDYFTHGRQMDIGAFDSPKPQGLPLGWVEKVTHNAMELITHEDIQSLHNGDTLTYFDQQGELKGFRVSVAEGLGGLRWRAQLNEATPEYRDLRPGVELFRSRDMAWERLMESERTADRRVAVDMTLTETAEGIFLDIRDEDGHAVRHYEAHDYTSSKDPIQALEALKATLEKLGNTLFEARSITFKPLKAPEIGFWPLSLLKKLRRQSIEDLEVVREKSRPRLSKATPKAPPARYPEDSLSYLANVFNHEAQRFYLKHGVEVVQAAYESHEETGDVSLMITKHCIRYSLSLCPKQTRGITGVQGTIRAEPLKLVNGKEQLTLIFDCKPCEMHVVGKIKPRILKDLPAQPIQFTRKQPG